MNQLQKENDSLRTNLLLAQTGFNKKIEEGENTSYNKQHGSENCNCKCNLLEQRVRMLGHDHLKYRTERLESTYINRNATAPETTEEKVLKENPSKVFEAQQMLQAAQTVLGSHNYNDTIVTRNSDQTEVDHERTSRSSKCSKPKEQTIFEKEAITSNSVGSLSHDGKPSILQNDGPPSYTEDGQTILSKAMYG